MTAAQIREHLCLGQSSATERCFATISMEAKAKKRNHVPEFVSLLNHDEVSDFVDRGPQTG